MDDYTIDMENIEHQSENENMTIAHVHLPSKRNKLVTTFHIFNIQLLIWVSNSRTYWMFYQLINGFKNF
jgi:hypothetical protein